MVSSGLEAIDKATSFQGVKKLCLQWRLAGQDGRLPFFEDVGLGSLGALADDTALFQAAADNTWRVLRVGSTVREQVGLAAETAAVERLDANFRDPLRDGIERALALGTPILSLARSVSEGLVVTFEILSLPLRSRWGGLLALSHIKKKPKSQDLVEAIYRSTSNGLLALAALPLSPDGPDFQIVSLNAGAAALFAKPEEELRWKLLSSLVPAADAEVLYPRLASALDNQTPAEFEFSVGSTHRGPLHLRISVAPIGNLLGVTMTDISDIKAREESVRSLFENNPMPLLLYDRHTLRILRVNDALASRYGFPVETWSALTLPDLHPPEERAAVALLAAQTATSQLEGRLWHHVIADGSTLDIQAHSRDLLFEGRRCVLTSLIDVTEQRRSQARVVFLAHHDPLTSLANRTLFHTCLEEGLAAVRRGEMRLALLCLDLDGFKAVNDSYGHGMGDAVLCAVAGRIRETICGKDLVARLGGDEFAVLQRDTASKQDIETLAQRLTRKLSAPFIIDGQTLRLGASVGIASAPEDATEADPLLKKADVALYRGKADGKGVYRFYEDAMATDDGSRPRNEVRAA